MKRLHITVEGQTEEEFVNETLAPHLANYSVYADARCVKTGRHDGKDIRGGMTNYDKAKNDIQDWIDEEHGNADVAFTTMFDYYQLPNTFPGYEAASTLTDPYKKVEVIEDSLKSDINDNRFLPYIQLHEFEALLFADIQKIRGLYSDNGQAMANLIDISKKIANPELIDNGIETAPSKRIIKQIPAYENQKTTVGPLVAQAIGIDTLKKACPHFREWVERLEQLGKTY